MYPEEIIRDGNQIDVQNVYCNLIHNNNNKQFGTTKINMCKGIIK